MLRRMNLEYQNNLEIYGKWEELKSFFINNSSDNFVLNLKNIEILDWDKDIMSERMEQMYYVFRMDEPPVEWLEREARRYNNLEFNLIYQSEERDLCGELVYKNGKLYNNVRENWDEECIEVL